MNKTILLDELYCYELFLLVAHYSFSRYTIACEFSISMTTKMERVNRMVLCFGKMTGDKEQEPDSNKKSVLAMVYNQQCVPKDPYEWAVDLISP